MALDELIRGSVTRDEQEQAHVYRYFLTPIYGTPMVALPADPPPYWSPTRDTVLRSTKADGLWASAVNIAMVRLASLGYGLSGDIGLRVKRSREMLGRDWTGLMLRFVKDYLVNDNGSFIEVVRATSAYASRVLGFVYLSSARCVRTGDPQVPVVYLDRLGRAHEMQAHQVAEFADMPDEDVNGVGLCATSRAYDAIYEHMAVHTFFKEKATGRRPLAIHFISGMGQKQIEQGLISGQKDADRKGVTSYMGAAVIGNPNATELKVVTVPLAELPDGFDQEKHEELTQVRYADALGIDPVDLNPRLIGNRALGAGSQAQVLDEKTQSKGLIALRQQMNHFFNDTERWHPLPSAVLFAWSEKDLKDQKAKADISLTRTQTSAARITAGITTAPQELQVQVDDGELPVEFLTVDQTPDETLTDEDKPEFSAEQVAQNAAGQAAQSQPDIPAPILPVVPVVTKAATTLVTMVPETLPRGRVSQAEKAYLERVTKEFEEYGRLLMLAAKEECPESGEPGQSGKTADSIKYIVTNKNTRQVTLKLVAGNAERPEVAIRAVLYGRKGFGPKHAKALRFQIGGETIFTKHVAGVVANDWFGRAWKRTEKLRTAMENRLKTSFAPDLIHVSDVPGAIKRTLQSQIKEAA